MSDSNEVSRRRFFKIGAATAVVTGLAGHAIAWTRALLPNVRYEPPKRRTLGPLDRFPKGRTFLGDEKLFIVRDKRGLRAMSAVCTHLGCTVGTKKDGYHCPCHGSRFAADGANLDGPAPRPLVWYALSLSGAGALVVDLGKEVDSDTVLETPRRGS